MKEHLIKYLKDRKTFNNDEMYKLLVNKQYTCSFTGLCNINSINDNYNHSLGLIEPTIEVQPILSNELFKTEKLILDYIYLTKVRNKTKKIKEQFIFNYYINIYLCDALIEYNYGDFVPLLIYKINFPTDKQLENIINKTKDKRLKKYAEFTLLEKTITNFY